MRALEDYWLGVQKERDDSLARIKELEEALALCYGMARLCPSDALGEDFDFVTPLEKAEALLNTQEEG